MPCLREPTDRLSRKRQHLHIVIPSTIFTSSPHTLPPPGSPRRKQKKQQQQQPQHRSGLLLSSPTSLISDFFTNSLFVFQCLISTTTKSPPFWGVFPLSPHRLPPFFSLEKILHRYTPTVIKRSLFKFFYFSFSFLSLAQCSFPKIKKRSQKKNFARYFNIRIYAPNLYSNVVSFLYVNVNGVRTPKKNK